MFQELECVDLLGVGNISQPTLSTMKITFYGGKVYSKKQMT